MKTVGSLVKRNVKLFFKDKGTFFTTLITPIILMVLYATFLYKVYEDSFTSSLPEGVSFMGDTLQGLVGGLLLSSLLSVTPVTVSFCANLCMVADKVSGARGDIGISPVKPRSVAISYYLSTVINGMIISLAATLLGCVYLAFTGWYLTVGDILCLLFDVTLLVLFGTALSSLICYPLTTQGQLSAVGSIVSSGYGFICGAYMPISSFSAGLRNVLSFFPGTYGTSLVRNHALQSVCEEITAQGFPPEALEGILTVSDCNLKFFGHSVEIWQMYLVLAGAVALLVGGYILLNIWSEKRKTK
jgi:multidrug/hemolysin transport system permease protein